MRRLVVTTAFGGQIDSPADGETVDGTGTMERRDAFVLLLVLSGAGYATYTHWDAISARLGLDDLHAGRIKAMELVKKSYDIDHHRTNWEVMQGRAGVGEIEIAGDPWQADPTEGSNYRVTCSYTERGARRCQTFSVDIANGAVVWNGETDAPKAAPR
jgi:hypothetical protein